VKKFDLIVVGAGPAGSASAALCAQAGKSVLLVESSRFPRDKVCGDCLNPSVWPVLEALGVSSRVRTLPKSSPKVIRFSTSEHEGVELPLPENQGEVVIRRKEFDALLVERAQELGVIFQDGTPVTSLRNISGKWEVTTANGIIGRAPRIIASDGRNSTVARHLRMHSSWQHDDRIGLQTHIPHPSGYQGALEMHLYRHGYGGLADLGNGLANLCLVANSGSMLKLRREAELRYDVQSAIVWRSITPISRPRARYIARNGVFLAGDAACVIEPFTGEGIAFALRTGAALAKILNSHREISPGDQERKYMAIHREIYSGKLRINRLTYLMSTHPKIARFLAPHLLRHPKLLERMLTSVLQ
jgi:flavin-dependent dehydrogenase